ncbi:MAG: TonB-dependent receptor domain-containing protein [Lysobacterales bacterium]
MDARWQISDSWMLSGALAYLDASYDDFTEAVCTAAQQVQHGIDTGMSPATCTQDLSGKELQFAPEWSGTINLEYNRLLNGGLELVAVVGMDYTDSYFTALDLDPHSRQDSFTKFNARIQLAGSSGWSVALIGKNLSDETTTTWVNDVPFFRGAFFGSMDAPRTLGVQARYQF